VKPGQPDCHTARWRGITLGALLVGYGGYYLCRSDLSLATPLLLQEFGGEGFTKTHIGAIVSVGLAVYALGSIVNGIGADLFGGRRLFLIGAAASAVCTVAFGASSGLMAFGALWALNGYFQSMGWVGLIGVAGRWFPAANQGTVMGLISISYLAGDAIVRLGLGLVLSHGVGWRGMFFVAAGTLAALTCANTAVLKARPADVGATDPDSRAGPVEASPARSRRALRSLLHNPTLWLLCGMSFGMTLVRQTFNQWTPTLLWETTGLNVGTAALSSLLFPLVGALAAVTAGVVTDRAGWRPGPLVASSLTVLVVALGALCLPAVQGDARVVLALTSAVAFFLMVPGSLCAGIVAMRLGGREAGATAAGIINSAGYMGAVLSGLGIGSVAQQCGWAAAFGALTAVAAGSAVLGVLFWARERREIHRGPRG